LKIIINADDFGRTHEVNMGIVKAMKDKKIDRTTLMVNMPYCDEAVKLAKEMGFEERIGLHINLCEGEPVNKSTQDTFLCTNGKFNSCINKRKFPAWRIMINPKERKAISDEVEAQMKKYEQYGLKLNHIDSHKHSHFNLGVLFSIRNLIKEKEISSIRIRNKDLGGSHLEKFLYQRIISIYKLKHSDYFFSYRGWQKMNNKEKYYDSKIELSVHPVMNENGEIVDSKGVIFESS